MLVRVWLAGRYCVAQLHSRNNAPLEHCPYEAQPSFRLKDDGPVRIFFFWLVSYTVPQSFEQRQTVAETTAFTYKERGKRKYTLARLFFSQEWGERHVDG